MEGFMNADLVSFLMGFLIFITVVTFIKVTPIVKTTDR